MFFAIPYFSHAHFLKETLESLRAQTDADWSAVVFDDSIDETHTHGVREVIDALSDSRILYRRNEQNLGLAKNWNQGLDYAEGRHSLATILHADDRLLPDYVAEMKALSKKYPNASGYFCRCEIIDQTGTRTFSLPDWYKEQIIPKSPEIVLEGIEGLAPLLNGNFIFCPSICYHLPRLKKERFRPEYRMVMDFEFTARILFNQGSWVGYYHRPLYQYRRHSENMTSQLSKNLVRFEEEMAFYKKLATDLRVLGRNDLAKRAGQFLNVKLNLCAQILISVVKLDWRLTMKQIRLLFRMCLE